MPGDKAKRALKKLAKHEAKLKSGKFGDKAKEGQISHYVNKEGKKLTPGYKSPEGKKPQDMEDFEPVYFKDKKTGKVLDSPRANYKGKIRLGGGVGRIPSTTPPRYPKIKQPDEKTPGTKSTKFYSEDLKKPEEKGVNVKSTTSQGLLEKTDEALKSTNVGASMTEKQKRFEEAPEFKENEAKRAAYLAKVAARQAKKSADKYVSGSRTEEQKLANERARQEAKGVGKEGSRKVYKLLKKREYRKLK